MYLGNLLEPVGSHEVREQMRMITQCSLVYVNMYCTFVGLMQVDVAVQVMTLGNLDQERLLRCVLTGRLVTGRESNPSEATS
jgi:hypothetical protein